MNRRGISFIEILLTIVLLSITMAAVLGALTSGLEMEHHFATARDSADETVRFEDELSGLLTNADLSDPSSVFLSPVPVPAGSNSQDLGGSGLAAGSASIVFTTWSKPPSSRLLAQSSGSWESLNGRFGPQGGTDQVAFSMTPVGDAGLKQGLFIRDQRPPQADPTIGGTERLYSPMVKDIRFEFYDGTTWQTAWDSKNDQKGKLPVAVRVTYLLLNEKTPRIFVTRLRLTPEATS